MCKLTSLPFYQHKPSKDTSEVQPSNYASAHMGPRHMLAQERTAWSETKQAEPRGQRIPHAPVSRFCSVLRPVQNPWGTLSAHITPGGAFSSASATAAAASAAPLSDFSSQMISCPRARHMGARLPRLCSAKYTWHSQHGRATLPWAQPHHQKG